MRQLARGPGAPAPPSALGAAPMPAKPQFLVTASDTATGTSQRRDGAFELRLDRSRRSSSFDFSRVSCVLLGTALSALRRRFQDTMKGMGESLYQSMDAPMAPLEKKVEAWRPAETCCFKLDLCAPLPCHPAPPRRSRAATASRPRWGPLPRLSLPAPDAAARRVPPRAAKPARCSSWR